MGPKSIENPTLIERFIKLLPLPYPLASLAWAIVLGSPGFLLVQNLATGAPLIPSDLPSLAINLLFFLLPLYLFYMVNYIRRKVVAAESNITIRLAGGEEDFHKAFGPMVRTLPLAPLTAILGVAVFPIVFVLGSLTPLGVILGLYELAQLFIDSLASATFIWMFAIASYGIHKLGGSDLKIAPYLEDRMMGAKPLGSLALSLTVSYFGALLLVTSLFYGNFTTNAPLEAIILALILLGITLFFLPLNSIHQRMQAEKRRLQHDIGARYSILTQSTTSDTSNASVDDLRKTLAGISDLQKLEALDRKVSSLPTWPFDIQVVSKFITIVLSVTAVLLSRIITGFLHI